VYTGKYVTLYGSWTIVLWIWYLSGCMGIKDYNSNRIRRWLAKRISAGKPLIEYVPPSTWKYKLAILGIFGLTALLVYYEKKKKKCTRRNTTAQYL